MASSLLTVEANAATNVWFFRGAGFAAWSEGIDQMARRTATLSGIGHVSVHPYYETQEVANQIRSSSSSDKTIVVGYSCGGNAAAVISQGITERHIHVIGIQPSIWCGTYEVRSNVPYAQDTYAPFSVTWGLGSARYWGSAHRIVLIERPDLHLEADTDPNAQRDVLGAIYAIANPHRAHWHINSLARRSHFIRTNGQSIWLRE
jgi:hypothetical protein